MTQPPTIANTIHVKLKPEDTIYDFASDDDGFENCEDGDYQEDEEDDEEEDIPLLQLVRQGNSTSSYDKKSANRNRRMERKQMVADLVSGNFLFPWINRDANLVEQNNTTRGWAPSILRESPIWDTPPRTVNLTTRNCR